MVVATLAMRLEKTIINDCVQPRTRPYLKELLGSIETTLGTDIILLSDYPEDIVYKALDYLYNTKRIPKWFAGRPIASQRDLPEIGETLSVLTTTTDCFDYQCVHVMKVEPWHSLPTDVELASVSSFYKSIPIITSMRR